MQLLTETLFVGPFCMTIVLLRCSKNNEVVIHSAAASLPGYRYCSSSLSQTAAPTLHQCAVSFRVSLLSLSSSCFFPCKVRLCPPTHALQSSLIVDELEGVNLWWKSAIFMSFRRTLMNCRASLAGVCSQVLVCRLQVLLSCLHLLAFLLYPKALFFLLSSQTDRSINPLLLSAVYSCWY